MECGTNDWAVMGKYNISNKLIEIIKSLYARAESTVQYGGTLSKLFKTNIGVRQGCPLSPALYNLFLERIMTDALDDFDGTVSIGGRKISNLSFADDIDLLAGLMEELSDLTTRLDTYGIN